VYERRESTVWGYRWPFCHRCAKAGSVSLNDPDATGAVRLLRGARAAAVAHLDALGTQALSTIAQPATCQFDLRVDSLTAPASAVIGVPFAVTDATTNVGTGVADPTVTKFYISARATFDATAVQLGSRARYPPWLSARRAPAPRP
jgi:hypothetical protein